MDELNTKLNAIQALLERNGLKALVLNRVSSFAWATCGAASYVNLATTDGAASLVITPTGRHLVTNNIEATRLEEEEKLKHEGWEFHVTPWYKSPDVIRSLVGKLKLGADGAFPGAKDLSTEIAHLRVNLTPEEVVRFRMLGRLCASAMDKAIRAVRPYMTEHEIAGLLAGEVESLGVQPIVNLVATDDRIFKYRHPLPTTKKLERYAMLVLCGRRAGLVCSITRLVHFGPIPDEIRKKAEAVARVDAALLAGTRPERALGEILKEAIAVYGVVGYPKEWQQHHQGGITGYEPREYLAMPDSPELVAANQAYAWNPSIAGTKSEDTILVGRDGNEVLTAIDGWPMISVDVNGVQFQRPAILEII